MGKRLLQHERSNITTLAGGGAGVGPAERTLTELALDYVGNDDGKVADAELRNDMVRHQIVSRAFGLTQRRTVEESESGNTPGFTTSIFKLYGANLRKETQPGAQTSHPGPSRSRLDGRWRLQRRGTGGNSRVVVLEGR